MAETPPSTAPIASGGRPASLANSFSNGTIGRIKSMRVAAPAEATDSPNKPAASAPAPIPGERPWYERSWDEIKRKADDTLQSWKKSGQTVWEALPYTSDEATAAAARGRIGEGIVGSLEGLGTLAGPTAEMVQGAYMTGDPNAIALVEEMQRRQREAVGAIGDSFKQAWMEAKARNGNAGAVSMVLASLGMEAVGGKGLGALLKTAEKVGDIVRLAKTPLEAANKFDEAIAAARAAGAGADEIALLERARAERLNQARKEAAKAKDGTVVVKKGRLAPNATYEINGYKYTTDEHGRIKSVEGTLRKSDAPRNDYAQRTVGEGDGRLPDDQGGHLIGSQFGGYGGPENLTPMHKDINNYHAGEWGKMEKGWASQIDAGNTVQVKIEPIYTDSSMRASSFKVTETINGNISRRTIPNPG